MVKKIRFENKSGETLQICIEPVLDYLDLEMNKSIEIELTLLTDNYSEDLDLDMVLIKGSLVIYESRKHEMKIFIDNELVYPIPE